MKLDTDAYAVLDALNTTTASFETAAATKRTTSSSMVLSKHGRVQNASPCMLRMALPMSY